MPSGLAGKAGKAGKASLPAANQPASEAGSFTAASPAGEYPDWLASLTKPDKTLGELNRMAEADRSHEDDMRLLKLSNRAGIKSKNFSKAKGV